MPVPTPSVSVILPTCNRPHLLETAIASVLRQTVDDWELVVVDNGSDPPASVPDDPRVRLVRLPENRGAAAGRNAGLDVATGRCIAFLDDDDHFTPNRLAIGLAGLEHAPVAVCASRFAAAPHRGSIRLLFGDVSETILDGSTPCLGATTIVRVACERFTERWHAVEDVEWWWRVSRAHAIHTIDEVGYLVGVHDGVRIDNPLSLRIEENVDLLREHAAWFDAHPRAVAFRLRRAGLIALSLGQRPLARRLFLRSLARRPSTRSTWHLLRASRPFRAATAGASVR